MTRTIHLLPDFDASLDRMAASGRYGTVDDVVMHALALLEDAEVVRDAREARLTAHLQEGLDDIAAGRTVPAEEVFEELRERFRSRRASRDAAE